LGGRGVVPRGGALRYRLFVDLRERLAGAPVQHEQLTPLGRKDERGCQAVRGGQFDQRGLRR